MFADINFLNEAALQMEDYHHFYSSDQDLRRSRMYKDKFTRGLIDPFEEEKKPHQYQRRHSIDILDKSMIVIDADSLRHRLSASSSVNNIIAHVQKEKDEVGRVTGWSVNFNKLLRDIIGLHVFTEHLKKEFSEENIIFWTSVEKYKQITSQEMRNVEAKYIFDKHLSVHASEPVNIDSVARQQAYSQLDLPTPEIFDLSQHQIYQLMKRDSYARFLKSELYKTYLLMEMEGKPLDIPQERKGNKTETDKKEKDSKKKIKGEENEDKEKRKRFMVPWRSKASKSGIKSSSATEAKTSKGKEKVQESHRSCQKIPQRQSLRRLSTKRNVLFWMELPNKKLIDVKAKSNRVVRVVLKPILHKHGFRMDSTEIYLSGHTTVLNLEGLVSSIENERVVVVSKDECP
ncbi:hypothetical protein ACJMK2_032366, partial [Sinanodonta woodiana]